MASDLNRCEFIGRLGRDPEVRYTPDGHAICNFSIACGWKSKDKEGTEWIRVSAFGKLAEICGEYLKKGRQVFVAGRMRTREYEKDGERKFITEVVCEQMQLLGNKDGGDNLGRSQASADDYRAARDGSAPRHTSGRFADMADDIPF